MYEKLEKGIVEHCNLIRVHFCVNPKPHSERFYRGEMLSNCWAEEADFPVYPCNEYQQTWKHLVCDLDVKTYGFTSWYEWWLFLSRVSAPKLTWTWMVIKKICLVSTYTVSWSPLGNNLTKFSLDGTTNWESKVIVS